MEEFLKKRALEMLRLADKAFELGMYNMTLFHCEQAVQLYLKYLLASRVGDYPRTHKMGELLEGVGKVLGEPLEFPSMTLDLLEEAYITSRYLPKEYSRETARDVLEFVKDFIRRLSKYG